MFVQDACFSLLVKSFFLVVKIINFYTQCDAVEVT